MSIIPNVSRDWQSPNAPGAGSNSTLDTRIAGYHVSTSIRGKCIPIIYGTRRVPANLVWLGHWRAKPIGNKLKGGGGKGGASQQYDYFSDVILALCQGPINAVGRLWVNNLQFYTSGGGSQVYTVPSGGGTYTPTFSNQIFIDAGVYILNSFSVSHNNFGSPGISTITGTNSIPLTSITGSSIAYVTIPNGQGGLYTASSPVPTVNFVDSKGSGATATANFTRVGAFNIVGSITVTSGGSGYTSGVTVVITGGDIVLKGASAYATLSSPSSGLGSGQYYFDSSTGTYVFGAAMTGTTVQIGYVWNPVAINGEVPTDGVGFAIITGGLGQGPWSYLNSVATPPASSPAGSSSATLVFPGQNIGYSEVALACAQQLELGSSGVLSNLSFEIFGFGIWGGGTGTGSATANFTNPGIIDAPPFLPLPVATAVLSGGGVASINLASTPSPWYTFAPYVQIIGNGSGATAVAVLSQTVNTGFYASIQVGLQTLTPASMTNIVVDTLLTIDTGSSMEQVVVLSTTSSTFTAVFKKSHYTVPFVPITSGGGQLIGINVTASGTGYTSASVYVGPTLQTAPAGIVFDILTNPLWGVLGFTPSDVGDLTDIGSYCIANGIFLSLAVDTQRSAQEYLKEILICANGEGFWSEGVLKFRTYGDTAAAGNGMVFIPQTAPIYDLDPDDFIVSNANEAGLDIDRPSIRDASNRITIEWDNRNNSYNSEPLDEYDQNMVDTYGLRPESTVKLSLVTTQPVAQLIANVRVQRSCYIRNKYKFTLPIIYSLLDPMDLVTLTDPELGLFYYPVRILSIEEDDRQCLRIEAEDFPWGTAKPTINPKEVSSTFGPGYYAPSGFTNPPAFVDLPPEVTQGNEYALGIALSGSINWGGCTIYVSTDGGNSYQSIGRQNGASTMGTITANLPAASDPDLTNTLAVYLGESFGSLSSYSAKEWNSYVSLIAVDNELMAYETATLTSAFSYNITNLHRGVYDSVIGVHNTGAPFCAINSELFQWNYSNSVIGKTVYFKFTAFNQYGQNEQDLSAVPAYPYLLEGPRVPYPWTTAYAAQGAGIQEQLQPAIFSIQQNYQVNADGSQLAQFLIKGYGQCNSFSTITRPPLIALTSSSTGGTIPGGMTLIVGVSAVDASLNLTQMTLESFTIPTGTNTNTLTVTATFFNPTHDSAIVYVSLNPEAGWGDVGGITVGSTVLVITSLPTYYLSQVPDSDTNSYLVRATIDAHGGIWGGLINAVTGGSGHTVVTVTGSTWTTNQLVGRVFSLLASANISAPMPVINVLITANTASTITLPVDLVTGTQYLFPNDVIEIRTLATVYSSTTIGDANFINGGVGQPGTGLTPNAEINNLVWIINGTGVGQQRLITANTTTTLTVASPFDIIPDATSMFIIINPSWAYSNPSNTNIQVSNNLTPIALSIPVDNSQQNTYVVQVLTVDKNGNTSEQQYSPFREIFQPGAAGSAGYVLITPTRPPV